MSFTLPDLVIESIIRDGLANLVKNPAAIDNVFESLTFAYNKRKYGVQELEKLKNKILTNQINVVHSFNEITATVPCFSIQLGSDVEDKRLARLGDFEEDHQEMFTDPEDLAGLIVLDQFVAQSYDRNSGKVHVDDSLDLSGIHSKQIFVDGSGIEFTIKNGVSNVAGSKFFIIEKSQVVDTMDFCSIKSSLNYRQYEINSVTSDVQIMLGVHSKDALTTKYLYTLLKYFLLSRKKDLIKRNFIVSTYSGSDFNRNFEFQGDVIYTRFLTASGKVEDSWKGSDVELIDNIEVEIQVPKDQANSNETNTTHSTVKLKD